MRQIQKSTFSVKLTRISFVLTSCHYRTVPVVAVVVVFLLTLLRWSETKKLKISIPDNIFFLYLIIIKLCTLKQLKNIHQKLKLIFS